jgi:hypothetical protein
MKCLSRIEIQKYLDKELEPSQMEEISVHLEKCEACSMVYKQAVADKALIDNVMNYAGNIDESASIPEFIPPVMYRKKTSIYRFIPYIVAASIIGFIFLLKPARIPVSEKIPEAEMLMYEFYDGKDLNKMWHEKSQIIILQDEKGNVIQSIITN